MEELEACCKTEEALKSFREFEQKMVRPKQNQQHDPNRWPQASEGHPKVVATRFGQEQARNSAYPSMMSGSVIFPTLAKPPAAAASLPKSKTMNSIKSVASSFRKASTFSSESTENFLPANEYFDATEESEEETRGRPKVSENRKASSRSTKTAGRVSSMRKSSADAFKRFVTDGAAKVRRFRRSLASGSADAEGLGQRSLASSWEKLNSSDEIGIAE